MLKSIILKKNVNIYHLIYLIYLTIFYIMLKDI